ncbi:MAG: MBL fold metallo-hydrolase [Planctomycetota bacterium]|nr:MBL fold metallo-hydrolase [Planctomycetota bacterium]
MFGTLTKMIIERIFDPDLAHAAWLIGCQKTKHSIVVDPARDIDRYINAANERKLKITAVTETHIHADFLSGSESLTRVTGAVCYLSREGGDDWQYIWAQESDTNCRLVGEGDVITVGEVKLKVIHTPGHTPEHICFLVFDAGRDEPIGIISGDFVFVGDLGRPDLLETAAGLEGTMEASARLLHSSSTAFAELSDFMQVWPAHGAGSACGKALGAVPQSTVGYEKRTNPPLQLLDDEQAFVSYMLSEQPEPPRYFAKMKQMNRDGVPRMDSLPSLKEFDNADELQIAATSATVIDTRPWNEVRDGHIGGTIWSQANGDFHRFAGSFVDLDEQVVLIATHDTIDRALRNAVRIGLDNVIGFATPKTLQQISDLQTMDELDAQKLTMMEEPKIIDVRKQAEHDGGCVDGAVHFAHTQIMNHLDEIDKEHPLIIHCQGGSRSAATCMALKKQGYQVANLAGGYSAWKAFTDTHALKS